MGKRQKTYSQVPWLRVKWRKRYAVVEFQMGPGHSLSEYDFRLEGFYFAYFRRHRPPVDVWPGVEYSQLDPPTMESGMTFGVFVVLPEHADEFARRVLMFITDPRNYSVDSTGVVCYLDDGVLCGVDVKSLLPKAKANLQRIRTKLTSECPELVDDPLDKIPGTDTVMTGDELVDTYFRGWRN